VGRSFRFILKRDIADLSPNRRLHWRQRHAREAAWKLLAAHAWAEAGSPWVGEKVRITFTTRRGRLLDPGNAVRSLALTGIENGLKGKAFPDDSARHIEYGSLVQEAAACYRHAPEVEVLVEEVD
jgi:hypothetical protein